MPSSAKCNCLMLRNRTLTLTSKVGDTQQYITIFVILLQILVPRFCLFNQSVVSGHAKRLIISCKFLRTKKKL